jgi:hypothetical protein
MQGPGIGPSAQAQARHGCANVETARPCSAEDARSAPFNGVQQLTSERNSVREERSERSERKRRWLSAPVERAAAAARRLAFSQPVARPRERVEPSPAGVAGQLLYMRAFS